MQQAADRVGVTDFTFKVEALLGLGSDVLDLLISVVDEVDDFKDQKAEYYQRDQDQRAEDRDPDVHDTQLAD